MTKLESATLSSFQEIDSLPAQESPCLYDNKLPAADQAFEDTLREQGAQVSSFGELDRKQEFQKWLDKGKELHGVKVAEVGPTSTQEFQELLRKPTQSVWEKVAAMKAEIAETLAQKSENIGKLGFTGLKSATLEETCLRKQGPTSFSEVPHMYRWTSLPQQSGMPIKSAVLDLSECAQMSLKYACDPFQESSEGIQVVSGGIIVTMMDAQYSNDTSYPIPECGERDSSGRYQHLVPMTDEIFSKTVIGVIPADNYMEPFLEKRSLGEQFTQDEERLSTLNPGSSEFHTIASKCIALRARFSAVAQLMNFDIVHRALKL